MTEQIHEDIINALDEVPVNEREPANPSLGASSLKSMVVLKVVALIVLLALPILLLGFPHAALATIGFSILVAVPGLIAVLNRADDRRRAEEQLQQ